MRLSPRIIQAMEILQLPTMALLERIEAEMQANPVLELREGGDEEPSTTPAETGGAAEQDATDGERPLVVKEGDGHTEDFQRLADYEEEFDPWAGPGGGQPRASAAPGERDRKMDAMANTPAPEQPLDEYLMGQWAFVEVPPAVKEAGRLIINRIEDDGYLKTPLEDIAKETTPPTDLAVLGEALRLIQTLDPIGVGARDLKECLLIQLAAEETAGRNVELERLIVERYLRDIEMNRLPAIAARTGKTIEQVKAALETISHLNPRPGTLVGQRAAPVIAPDITVRLGDDGEPVITMDDGAAPAMHISRMYRKLAKDRRTAREARAFLQRNIRSAQWLISAIQLRRQTVRRVAEEVFKAQRDFLAEGPQALRPLPMMDVANKVGVHIATVSRAVAGKYVQTPWGIFPLRMFFAGGTTTAGGEDIAYEAVRVRLKELVDAEDKSAPLDDDKLAKELEKHGIKIARRTVAKYRDLMDIPPARKRRQF